MSYLARAQKRQQYADPAYTGAASYAQFGEDLILIGALNTVDHGFYIDVGAWDEVKDSVTKLFYDKGWNGINVEPCPRWFNTLVAPRSRDINLCLAASDYAGVVTLHEISETGLSTTVTKYADQYLAQGLPHRAYSVPCRPLREICAKYVRGDIHFLKIDVEGAEKPVLQGCDFNRFRPWLLVIEATVPTTQTPCYEEWEDLVLGAGYEFALAHEVNRYYVARERLGLKALIQRPESSLVSEPSPILPAGHAQESCTAGPPAERGREANAGIPEKVPSKPKPFLRFARTTILAYVIAIFGLALIAAGAWDIYLFSNEQMFEVTLSDYGAGIRTIAGGFIMIGLAQALRLLLEINVRG
jgi:FkbM family methyltransferase